MQHMSEEEFVSGNVNESELAAGGGEEYNRNIVLVCLPAFLPFQGNL